MGHILLERHDDVAVVRLNNGATNAINDELVRDFSEALKKIASENFKGMVLCGGKKFFSIGLDVPYLLNLTRTQMTTFMSEFNDLCINLYKLPIPTCCAISGHVIAGGYILGLTCDNRIAAAGKARLGLNEVNLGVPVPYPADLMLRQIVGDRVANTMMFGGELISVAEAQKNGLVDTVIEEEHVEKTALANVAKLAGLPQAALSVMKAARTETIGHAYEKYNRARIELFLDCWFSETGQKLLRAAAKKF